MIVLHTNVLSELMRARPDDAVVAWADARAPDQLLTTANTVADILHGIARLPDGRRKSALHEAAIETFADDFAGRILVFDELAAEQYAELVSARERSGQPISMADAQIAAICRCQDAPLLATRNLKDFRGLGINLINPWEAA